MFKTGLEKLVEKAASMDKEAIGERQKARIQAALEKMPPGTPSGGNEQTWAAARGDEHARQNMFSPVYTDLREHARNRRRDGAKYLPPESNVGRDSSAIDKILTSGRHRPTDIVSIPPLGVDAVNTARLPGVYPERLTWRGHQPGENSGTGPRWTSGVPAISTNYMDTPSARLDAYALGQIPDSAQGPWTSHIAIDPRSATSPRMQAGVDALRKQHAKHPYDLDSSPVFEKVVDAEHLPTPSATYKPLATPGKFQLTRGPNLLRGEGVEAIAPHLPTVERLTHDAPKFVESLNAARAVPSIGREVAQFAGLGSRLRAAAGAALKHPYALPVAGGAALLGGLGLYAHQQQREG